MFSPVLKSYSNTVIVSFDEVLVSSAETGIIKDVAKIPMIIIPDNAVFKIFFNFYNLPLINIICFLMKLILFIVLRFTSFHGYYDFA